MIFTDFARGVVVFLISLKATAFETSDCIRAHRCRNVANVTLHALIFVCQQKAIFEIAPNMLYIFVALGLHWYADTGAPAGF